MPQSFHDRDYPFSPGGVPADPIGGGAFGFCLANQAENWAGVTTFTAGRISEWPAPPRSGDSAGEFTVSPPPRGEQNSNANCRSITFTVISPFLLSSLERRTV